MSFKRRIFRFLREWFKDAGIGFALLGTGGLAFQSSANASDIFYGILFIVIGGILNVLSLIMLLLEDIVFEA